MRKVRKVLTRRGLREQKGIGWSRQYLFERVKAGNFPAPAKTTDAPNSPNIWFEDEIDAWIEARRAARDRQAVSK